LNFRSFASESSFSDDHTQRHTEDSLHPPGRQYIPYVPAIDQSRKLEIWTLSLEYPGRKKANKKAFVKPGDFPILAWIRRGDPGFKIRIYE